MHVDALIIGGGPTGLFLGCALAARGIRFRVLEKRLKTVEHSRSIGIHPPSLEAFDDLDLVKPILAAGHQLNHGVMHHNHRPLAGIDFSGINRRFPFVITLPQSQTETILAQALEQRAPGVLLRGREVTHLSGNEIHCQNGERYSAEWIIGCDGKHSQVRKLAGIAFPGAPYPEEFIMGDFSHTTENSSIASKRDSANIHLCEQGLVESFPLPNQRRRIVAYRANLEADASAETFCEEIQKRIGVDLSQEENFMLSAFTVERYLADTFVKNNVLLAGDAAHVLSPIGGQGMNLGWLDAMTLAKEFPDFKTYAQRRRICARKAIKRAETNMFIARPTAIRLKVAVTSCALRFPSAWLRRRMAEQFTMRGLE